MPSQHQQIDVIIPTCRQLHELHTSTGAFLPEEIERTAGCAVNVIATCQPVCAAKNRNLGLEQAISDIRIMMDDDIERMPDGWVARMADVMAEHPDCVMLSPELMSPDGSPGFMVGRPNRGGRGVSVVSSKHLPTACIAIRRDHLRFDDGYKGSGFEDNDYCKQQEQRYPNGIWLICHDIKVVHKNEMKRQREFWNFNRARYIAKWKKGVHLTRAYVVR